jgi:hypothetical protein
MSQKYAHLDADRVVIGFYDDWIHAETGWPEEAEPITDETWTALLDGHGEGKLMALNGDGSPDLREQPPPPDDLVAAQARAQRNAALDKSDWIIARQEEAILTGTAQDNAEHFNAYVKYRQALRDVPQQEGFPQKIDWPVDPGTK